MMPHVRQPKHPERSFPSDFINSYLVFPWPPRLSASSNSGDCPAEARRLDRSHAAKAITSLMNLTVDTSWFLSCANLLPGNPDLATTFSQIVDLQNCQVIPNFNLPPAATDTTDS